ncbi:hypothetical protein [Planotetraspora kaengkrachanensis]|uniref:Uncharacterized protein n=1 Tax=Planotetraspora kaengkrachanensis TaxID=575193 RepID=A0A8J3PT26_9ACTN|nr:hypothetical protein [Planotetraspora kaengkrachanensis]GIG80239.1 hypothetical protein Pka01_33660 [Planotetraspora kaengkrachanensis]
MTRRQTITFVVLLLGTIAGMPIVFGWAFFGGVWWSSAALVYAAWFVTFICWDKRRQKLQAAPPGVKGR